MVSRTGRDVAPRTELRSRKWCFEVFTTEHTEGIEQEDAEGAEKKQFARPEQVEF